MSNFLFTGEKNSGKSTSVHEMSKNSGFSCGGVISLPVVKDGKKIGMNAIDIMTNKAKELARMEDDFEGIVVGKYKISGEGIKHGENAICRAVGNCKLVIIDEIGPLEMGGGGLINAAEYAFESDSNIFIVVRSGLKDEFIEKYGRYEFNIIDAGCVRPDELAKIIEKEV